MHPPSPEVCRALLDTYAVPGHIRRHSEEVARLARDLAEGLRRFAGEELDAALVEAGGLLHDIAKATCLDSRSDHAREGGRLLRGLGYEEVAALVERHVAIGAWNAEAAVTEAEVLNYSDKRVRHEEVVTLAERFEDLLARYGGTNGEARARIRHNWRVTADLEKKIFRRLPFGPEDLR
ncbi:MAG: HD domain-containing protein [Deltaproteobacteria bacterium]|nr:HD domain-containing protein [Deltaproteobacteria bacterium]